MIHNVYIVYDIITHILLVIHNSIENFFSNSGAIQKFYYVKKFFFLKTLIKVLADLKTHRSGFFLVYLFRALDLKSKINRKFKQQ